MQTSPALKVSTGVPGKEHFETPALALTCLHLLLPPFLLLFLVVNKAKGLSFRGLNSPGRKWEGISKYLEK